MRKDGFSIAEFLISITIMFVIAAAALPTLLMKKAKEPVEFGKEEGKYVCSCAEGDGTDAECEFTFTKDMGEFFAIQIVGGGAGGGSHKGGGAGESKVVHYPGMDGKYLIKLGRGGNARENGGYTAIYRKDYTDQKNTSSTGYTLVEFARGGIYTDEIVDEANPDKENLKKGETPTYSEFSEPENATLAEIKKVCGRGGNTGAEGNAGEVVIRW